MNNVKARVFKKLKPFNKIECQIYEHVFQEMIKKHVKSFISFLKSNNYPPSYNFLLDGQYKDERKFYI